MNKQEIFDTVSNHLFTQGVRAYENDGCKYRIFEEGVTLKCAAGCLIDDEIYSPNMELARVPTLIKEFKNILPTWFVEESDLINDLQSIHDSDMMDGREFDFVKLTKGLNTVATKYNLKKLDFPDETVGTVYR